MGQYPAECQSQQIVNTKLAIDDKPAFVIYLENTFGLNFSPFFSNYVRAGVIKGIWVTFLLSMLSIVGSLAVRIVHQLDTQCPKFCVNVLHRLHFAK